MDSPYTSQYPEGAVVPSAAVEFFQEFYRISDTPDAHVKYADLFTDDATFILASKLSTGRDEILATRQGMWAAVSARQHRPLKVFPFGSDGIEFMLYGTVEYTFKTGLGSGVDWAARAVLAEVEGRLRLKFYQVYLDTAAMAKTK